MEQILKAVIIDDEAHCIETLRFEIKRYCPEIEVIATASNGSVGIEIIQKLKPDLVFLDIEMPDMNGFNVLQSLGDFDFHLIFVTAYDQYAIKAFKYSAIDYLLKPLDGEDLANAMKRIDKNVRIQNRSDQLQHLLSHLKGDSSAQKKVGLPVGYTIEFVFIKDIIRVEASGNYSISYLSDGRKLTMTKTLKEIELILESDNFFRIHKSHLINKEYIKRYIKKDGGYIELSTSEEFRVTRYSKDEILALI